MHAFVRAAVLLSIMLISRSMRGPVGDIVRRIVNLYTMTSASHSLKSSENVTLCQVRELGKRSFVELLRSLTYYIAVQSSESAPDVDVLLDSELQMKQHVNKVASTCYYNLR